MKQHAHSLVRSFRTAETLEEGAGDDHISLQARPEEAAEEGKA
jgi:hypothetical protein